MENSEDSNLAVTLKVPYKTTFKEIHDLKTILFKSMRKLGLQNINEYFFKQIKVYKWIRYNKLNVIFNIFEPASYGHCKSFLKVSQY